MDHTLRNPALKEWKKKEPFVALMEYWFIFLEFSQRDFGQLINDSFFRHFTQTDMPTSNKLEMNSGRVLGAPTHRDGCHCVPRDDNGHHLRNVSGQSPCLHQRLSTGELGPRKQ